MEAISAGEPAEVGVETVLGAVVIVSAEEYVDADDLRRVGWGDVAAPSIFQRNWRKNKIYGVCGSSSPWEGINPAPAVASLVGTLSEDLARPIQRKVASGMTVYQEDRFRGIERDKL